VPDDATLGAQSGVEVALTLSYISISGSRIH